MTPAMSGGRSCGILQAGRKGFVELQLLKFRMHTYLLHDFLDSHEVGSATKQKLREVFENHATYRKFSGFPNDTHHDLTWQAGWTAASLHVCRLIEDPLPCDTRVKKPCLNLVLRVPYLSTFPGDRVPI